MLSFLTNYSRQKGNWYDVEETNPTGNNSVLMALKLAIDNNEKVNV